MGLPDLIQRQWRHHPEFQSAGVRLGIWLFAACYIGLAAWTGYYRVDLAYYEWLFPGYLLLFVGLAIDVVRHPTRRWRRYLALGIDVSATSLAIFLTREAVSPFYLLYIWIFISYGTRYGKHYLSVASVLSLLAYNLVLIALGEWQRHSFEAFFFLLLLAVLPLYQFSLLRKLEEARQEAERANQAKGDFLSTMTHELRTPLTGVIGMTQLLEGTALRPEQREYVDAIASSAHLLHGLIGDVLDLSKLEAHRVRLERVPLSPGALILEVCTILEGQAIEQGLELVCEVAPEVPAEVEGDPLRLRQVLLNLVGNGLKFTTEGQVVVRCAVAPPDGQVSRTHLLLEVEDSGIGIPADKLGQVFDGFWQADDSTTRRFGGSGLGTTIARDLTRLMGGTIGVAGEEGKGTRFWVKLPLLPEGFVPYPREPPALFVGRRILLYERNAAGRRALLEACQGLGLQCQAIGQPEELQGLAGTGPPPDLILVADSPRGEDLDGLQRSVHQAFGEGVRLLLLSYARRRASARPRWSHRINKPFTPETLAEGLIVALRGKRASGPTTPTPRVAASGTPDPLTKGHILVAEDNAIAGRVITTLLQRQGYRTSLALDGESALAELGQQAFDLAFVDLRMPKIDGLELARRQRAREDGGRRLPLIALTANAAEEVRQQCLAAGMDDFLAKPVDPKGLTATLRRYLQGTAPAPDGPAGTD